MYNFYEFLVRVFITKLLKILCFTAFKTYSNRALPIKTDNERNMIMEKYITKNGIKYELRGEQYYPMLEISEQTNYEIGKYGHLHLDFMKKHRRGTYTTLLTEGRLNEHLHTIDEQAHEQMESYITQAAERVRRFAPNEANNLADIYGVVIVQFHYIPP